MILSIAAIDDSKDVDAIRQKIAKLRWRDGRATAGASAKKVKRNLQAVMSETAGRKLREEISALILGNMVVKAAARPRRLSPIMISKTKDGGHYGAHVDNAIMGSGENRLRTDLSFTLFLADSDTYEGGELVIHHAGVTQEIKGEAGQMVLYPSSSIHEVRPVTKGERLVCVGWIESMIADPIQRELLFDMENLRTSLRASLPANCAELITLDKSIAGLLRLWATP